MNFLIILKRMNSLCDKPLVSVIVTTYNRSSMLKKTIYSILSQTYTNFELLVVDNYSSYDFYSFIRAFRDKRIEAFQNNNKGVIAVNRNFGIEKAKGRFIAFCDDDDVWLPEKLFVQVKSLLKGDYGICYTNSVFVNIHDKVVGYRKNKNKYYSPSFVNFFLSGGYICTSSVVISSDCINNIGVFDESEDLFSIEDFEYWARILHRYKGCYVDKSLVRYRLHNNNSQSIVFIERLRKSNNFIKSLDLKVGVKSHLKIVKYIKLIIEKILDILA